MRILVTGGTSGIGAALVRESLRAGHTIFTTGRDAGRVEAFLDSCSGLGGTANRGHFVLMGSIAGRKVYPGNLYTATKWAVTGYSESFRQQLVGTGVRVLHIAPDHVDTPLWKEAPDAAIAPESVAATMFGALAQPPGVDVSEVAIRATGQTF